MKYYTIILPVTQTNIRYYELFFESLERHSVYKHEIFTWINGIKNPNIVEYLKKKSTFTYQSDNNIGQSIPYNRMIKDSTSDIIFFADQDFYFMPKWDDLIKESRNEFYCKTPLLIESNRPTRSVRHDFGSINNFNEQNLLKMFSSYVHPLTHYGGFMPCFMSKKDYYNIGCYNEDFFVGEADFLYRQYLYYTENNYVPLVDNTCKIYHFRQSDRPANFDLQQKKMFDFMEDKYKKTISEIDNLIPFFEVIDNEK